MKLMSFTGRCTSTPSVKRYLLGFFALSLAAQPFVCATTGQDWFYMMITVESVDPDNEVLTTRYFESAINIRRDEAFAGHIFHRDQSKQTDDFFNVSRFEQYSKHVWRYVRVTYPEQGSPPKVWPLVRTGVFPDDRYTLHLLVALNATADFSDHHTTVYLRDDLRTRWNVAVEFQRFPAQPTLDDLKSMMLDHKTFNDRIRDRCMDFYQVKVVFSRPDIEKARFTFHSMVAWCLLALVAVSTLLLITQNLGRDSVLQICLGVAFFAVPNLIWLQGYLPKSGLDLIERLFMVDVLWAILLTIFAILYEPLRHLYSWLRHRVRDTKKIR